MGLRDEPVRGREVRRHDRRRSKAGASPARSRSAARSACSRPRLAERMRRRCWRSTSPRPRSTQRARRASRTSPSSGARSPRSSRTARIDLVVVSEVLYYLDAPAFDATLDAIERTLQRHTARRALAPGRAERYPLTGDEVHERLQARFGPPAYTPPDRRVHPRPLRRYAARDRRRRARRRSPPPARTGRRAATATSRCSRPS